MADNYYPTDECDDIQEQYNCINCDELIEHARVRHAGAVKKSYLPTLLADVTNPAVWAAGIASGDIDLIPDVIGTWNGGEPKEAPGFGDQTTSIETYEHEVNFKDQRFKTNSAFYGKLGKSKDRVFFFVTESLIFFSTKPASYLPKSPAGEDLTGKILWEVKVKWVEGDVLIPHDRVDEILSCAFIAAQAA